MTPPPQFVGPKSTGSVMLPAYGKTRVSEVVAKFATFHAPSTSSVAPVKSALTPTKLTRSPITRPAQVVLPVTVS